MDSAAPQIITEPQQIIQIAETTENFSNQWWRLNNLYYIQNKQGQKQLFNMNTFQERLFTDMDFLNVILKARQFGFTTFIDIFALDSCLFNENTKAGIIAHNLVDANKIFSSKIAYPFKNLPEALQLRFQPDTKRTNQYTFPNDSEISVSSSFRSGTLQILHVSEYGKIAAKYPEKAKEIKTGAFEAVAKGQMIFVESTAEGRGGEFFDMVKRARDTQASGRPLTEMDFKFHFYAWYENPEYQIKAVGIPFPQEKIDYFIDLEKEHGIKLTREQQAWYVLKAATLKDDMKREYPSTADEAFESVIDGSYYGKTILKLRQMQRITKVPYEPLLPVHTFWDLGFNDKNAIWFYQQRGMERRLIDYYENSGEGLAHYKRIMDERGYIYGTHYFPHDGGSGHIQTGKKTEDVARGMGIRPLKTVKRAKNQEEVLAGIENVRNLLLTVWIDEEKCATGIRTLEEYRKEWDEDKSSFKKTPLHNWASNGADSLRTGAVGMSSMLNLNGEDLMPEPEPDY